MQARELANRIDSREAPCVLDVRCGFEYRAGHIPGAIHAPAWKILVGVADLPRHKEASIVLTCKHGPRAWLAKGLLTLAGYRKLELLAGHVAAWRHAGLPLDK